jgi:hypothetical protein
MIQIPKVHTRPRILCQTMVPRVIYAGKVSVGV